MDHHNRYRLSDPSTPAADASLSQSTSESTEQRNQPSTKYQSNTEKRTRELPTISSIRLSGRTNGLATFWCDVPDCRKEFKRLYELRSHIRAHHLEARPEQTSTLDSSNPPSFRNLTPFETADTESLHQYSYDDWDPSVLASDFASFRSLQVSDPEFYDGIVPALLSSTDPYDILDVSRELPLATPRLASATNSHRIMNELVSKALQDLEVRLELTQHQKITGQGGRKASPRKRGNESAESQQQPSTKRQAVSENQWDDLKRDISDFPSDDDLSNPGPAGEKDRSKGDDTGQKYLACPLYRKDPRKYSACGKCRLRRIRDVKQHMRRKHRRPEYYCPTCWETYSGPDERDQHVIERSCNTPEEQSQPWITQEQDVELEGRVPNGSTVEQWYTLWDIVCPGQIRPKPPFCFLGEMVENLGTLRQEIWEEEGPEIAEQLIAQREATLREPLTRENRNLLKRCIMDAVRYVLKHPDVTKAGKVRWNQDSGQSEAAPVFQGSGARWIVDVPGDSPDANHHQPHGSQDDLLHDGHTSITSQGFPPGGTQLGNLDLTSWWAETFEGFDAGHLNFLDAFSPAVGEGHETAFEFAGGPTSA